MVLKTFHRVIKFHKNAWLKPYIDINTDLRKKNKKKFEKIFLKLMNNAVFRKTMENVRKNRDIKLVTTERRRNDLVSELSYHTATIFRGSVLAIETKMWWKSKIMLYGYTHKNR